MPIELSEVPTEELMKEIQHRLDCTKKPEKRVILIGEHNVQFLGGGLLIANTFALALSLNVGRPLSMSCNFAPTFPGPPGCGKGTQSPRIKYEHCLCHLATGDMLRAAVAAKTPLGLEVRFGIDRATLLSFRVHVVGAHGVYIPMASLRAAPPCHRQCTYLQ